MSEYYFPTANIHRLYPYAVNEALNRDTLWEPSYAEFEDPEFFEKIERDAELKRLLNYRSQLVASERWFLEPASDSPEDRRLANIITSLIKKIPRLQARRMLLSRAFWRSSAWLRITGGFKVINLPTVGQGRWWTISELKDVDKREFELQRNHEAEKRDPHRRRFWRWMLADKSSGDVVYKPINLRDFVRHVYQDEERGVGHGTSIADALYYLNWFKQETLRNGMQFLGRWSQGLLVYTLDILARGEKDTGTSGKRASDALAILNKIRSGNDIVINKGDAVEQMDTPNGGWSTAREALQYLDEQASRLILGSVTNTGGGTDKGSLARAETEKDSMEALIQFDRGILDETMTEQIVKPLIENNWALLQSIGLGSASVPHFRSSGDANSDPKSAVEIFSTLAEKMPAALARVPVSHFFQSIGVTPVSSDDGVETMADIIKEGAQTTQEQASAVGAGMPAGQGMEQTEQPQTPPPALDSSSINALMGIVKAISEGSIAAAAASEIISAAFPNFPPDTIMRMVNAAAAFQPPPKQAPITTDLREVQNVPN